jgi:hypothetical protein
MTTRSVIVDALTALAALGLALCVLAVLYALAVWALRW